MASSPEVRQLDASGRVEMLIVASGARRDMGQPEAAALLLQGPELSPGRRKAWSARLFYAYAEAMVDVRAHRRGAPRGSVTRPTPTRRGRPTPTSGSPSCSGVGPWCCTTRTTRPTPEPHGPGARRRRPQVGRGAAAVHRSRAGRRPAPCAAPSSRGGQRSPPRPRRGPWPSAPLPPQHRPGTSTRCTWSAVSPASLAGASCRAATCWCPSAVVVSRAPARRGARHRRRPRSTLSTAPPGGPTCSAASSGPPTATSSSCTGACAAGSGGSLPGRPAAARWRWCG